MLVVEMVAAIVVILLVLALFGPIVLMLYERYLDWIGEIKERNRQ